MGEYKHIKYGMKHMESAAIVSPMGMAPAAMPQYCKPMIAPIAAPMPQAVAPAYCPPQAVAPIACAPEAVSPNYHQLYDYHMKMAKHHKHLYDYHCKMACYYKKMMKGYCY